MAICRTACSDINLTINKIIFTVNCANGPSFEMAQHSYKLASLKNFIIGYYYNNIIKHSIAATPRGNFMLKYTMNENGNKLIQCEFSEQ